MSLGGFDNEFGAGFDDFGDDFGGGGFGDDFGSSEPSNACDEEHKGEEQQNEIESGDDERFETSASPATVLGDVPKPTEGAATVKSVLGGGGPRAAGGGGGDVTRPMERPTSPTQDDEPNWPYVKHSGLFTVPYSVEDAAHCGWVSEEISSGLWQRRWCMLQAPRGYLSLHNSDASGSDATVVIPTSVCRIRKFKPAADKIPEGEPPESTIETIGDGPDPEPKEAAQPEVELESDSEPKTVEEKAKAQMKALFAQASSLDAKFDLASKAQGMAGPKLSAGMALLDKGKALLVEKTAQQTAETKPGDGAELEPEPVAELEAEIQADADAEGWQSKVEGMRSMMLAQAMELGEKYKVKEKATMAASIAESKLSETKTSAAAKYVSLDQKYDISGKATAKYSSLDQKISATKADLDDKYGITSLIETTRASVMQTIGYGDDSLSDSGSEASFAKGVEDPVRHQWSFRIDIPEQYIELVVGVSGDVSTRSLFDHSMP